MHVERFVDEKRPISVGQIHDKPC